MPLESRFKPKIWPILGLVLCAANPHRLWGLMGAAGGVSWTYCGIRGHEELWNCGVCQPFSFVLLF